ncbi:MAG: HEPN domain-containing protein [Candidatus Eisenbacteria bacterium]
MPPDVGAEARRWFVKASSDLRAAEVLLGATPPFVEHALFHAQQAAEKAVKGFLVWHGRPFRKVHDLREVGGAALALDASLEPVLRRAARLSPFAGVFRYPTDMGEPTVEEARDALALAREVYDVVLSRLPEEVRP